MKAKGPLATFAVVLLAAGAGRDAPQGAVVLDETAYWRHYYQFGWDLISPRELKKPGAREMMTPRSYSELKRCVEIRLSHEKTAPGEGAPPGGASPRQAPEADWRDRGVVRMRHVQGADTDPRLLDHCIYTDPPPPGWTAPDFDDGAWGRARRPLLVGADERSSDWAYPCQGIPLACFRTYFDVPDVAKAGELSLRLVYHGGVRVFVNGTELTRGHLPGEPGEHLPPDARGADYPLEAYVRLPEELTDAERKRYEKYGHTPLQGGHCGPAYVPELPGRWEDARVVRTAKEGRAELRNVRRGRGIEKRSWQRLTKLRDRRIEVKVPPALVRKGTNVLAVELRASCLHPITHAQAGTSRFGWGPGDWGDARTWGHAQVRELRLDASGEVPSALVPPSGRGPAGGQAGPTGTIRAWAEDAHRRVYHTEFLPPGEGAGQVRVVGGQNGTYSGQIVVGSDRDLTDVRVVCGELTARDGPDAGRAARATIPASAIEVCGMAGHPLSTLSGLGQGRGTPNYTKDPRCEPALLGLKRYGPPGAGRLTGQEQLDALEELTYFDHISPAAPTTIRAGRCQPYWLRLKVPADAAPGTYTGAVTVSSAGGGGAKLPLTVEVLPWRVPAPKDFQTIVALEQSPYGVARHYKVPAWSGRHFELMEGSFRQLGRVGNDWLFVPVMLNSEFGNRADSPVRWVRQADGTIELDFTILDRYLDLAERHLGRPRVVSFVVMDGHAAHVPTVAVMDERTGLAEPVKLIGPGVPLTQTRRMLSVLGTKLPAHMTARGLDQAMHWGYTWDAEGFPEMKSLLGEYAPAVKWSAGPHSFRLPPEHAAYYSAVCRIYGKMLGLESRLGWKVAFSRTRGGRSREMPIALLGPRHGGSVHCTNGNSPPFSYRVMVDRAFVAGNNGIGRIGADYWDGAYYDGAGGTVWCQSGIGTLITLWPGQGGAESSARFEMLLEGIQEGEIRVFCEQALDRGLLGEPLARKVRKVLFDHNRETFFIPVVHPAVLLRNRAGIT